ncbi:MAG: hypothetical protein M3394_06100, partial [Actinomycetota bacterium]|nr:hypothetical protein [Actinomycetota bacterium]
PAPAPAAGPGGMPSRDDLTKAWGDSILKALPQRAKARFAPGRFVQVEGEVAEFALPNAIHRDRCDEVRADVEAALAAHFGMPIRLRLVVEDGRAPAPPQGAPPPADEPEEMDAFDPGEAAEGPAVTSVEDRLKQAFPGAEEVDSP